MSESEKALQPETLHTSSQESEQATKAPSTSGNNNGKVDKKSISTICFFLSLIGHSSKSVAKLVLPKALQTEERVRATNSLVASYSGNDSNLAFTGYSLLFVSEILKRLPNSSLPLVQILLAKLDPKAIESLAGRARTASNLISDIRIFNRLWGLIPLSVWAFDTFNAPPTDPVLKNVAYLQVIVNLIYQPLENVAYLAMHNVIGGLSADAQTKLWLRSCYLWAAHVVLDFIRIYREYQVTKSQAVAEAYKDAKEQVGEAGAKNVTPSSRAINQHVQKAIAAKKFGWVQALIINLSYLPLTIHWSLEKGCLSDIAVGFLGATAAAANIIPKWSAISSLGSSKEK